MPQPLAPRVDLSGTTAVITGAAAGSIGAALAVAMREWGADVVTTTRSGVGDSRPLELTDRASVDAFAASLAGRRIDVLVNNAGVHLDLLSRWHAPHLVDGHEIHWRTNYLGTMHLTHRLLPQVGRVVNVVSKLHARGRNAWLFAPVEPYSSWDAYGTSKLALVHATNELARRGHPAFSVHPGEVFTNIADKGLDGHRLLGAVRRTLAPLERRALMSPTEGAQSVLLAATAPDLPNGSYLRRCQVAPASPEADDAAVAGRLWEQTADWVEHG